MPDVNLDDFDNPGDDDDFDLAPKARKQTEPPAAEESVKNASVAPAAVTETKRVAKAKPTKKATPAKKRKNNKIPSKKSPKRCLMSLRLCFYPFR